MARITLAETKFKKLKKESRGNQSVLRNLCRESMARKWLKVNGIPSWRNPATPSEKTGENTPIDPRYSIMLADGSRFLVCSFPSPTLSLDMLAASKCFAALAVDLENDFRQGSIMGCLFLRDLSRSIQSCDFEKGGLRSNWEFLDYPTAPKSYTSELIRFSIRLLLSGEPDAPERGTEGVKSFRTGRT